MAQLMPLPLAVSCSNKIQIGFTFLVPAHLGSPGQRAVERVCVCVCVCVHLPDRSEFRSTADRIGTTSSRYRRRDRRTWRYCDTGLTSRSRPPPYLLPTTPFAAAESASEKKFQIVNIRQICKQERGCLVHFARLANTLLEDEEGALDNHILAYNFARYSLI